MATWMEVGQTVSGSIPPSLLKGVLWELGASKELRQQQQHHPGSLLSFQAIVPPSVFQHLFCLCSHLLFARTIRVALVYLFPLMASGYKWLNS